MDEHSSRAVEEMRENLGVDVSSVTVWKRLKKLGFTYKMTRPIYEKRNCEETKMKRIDFIRWYTSHSPMFRYKNIISIDESPFYLYMSCGNFWARRGQTPNPIIRPRQENVTMILAFNGTQIIHSEAIFPSVNSDIFKEFLAEVNNILDRTEQYVLVMEMLHFITTLILTTISISIRHLPPYSPFLNPCEEVFLTLKAM
ncbi:hypothetical protein RF11_10443 [Thelohanellus kitauei]|uniref:Tc1-like transposase DDE domain-containing protein n=1 Tax=Thelohanellus kitauei TaxID=669202 RepID=A0A0C2NFN3_THEKT|nr:hypothetical protein RF11_10443 [Thelohanellus kitauei]